MLSFLISLFTSDPTQKLIKERDRKYRQAVHYQRNGNLREYASLIKEISILEERIVDMQISEPEDQTRTQ